MVHATTGDISLNSILAICPARPHHQHRPQYTMAYQQAYFSGSTGVPSDCVNTLPVFCHASCSGETLLESDDLGPLIS